MGKYTNNDDAMSNWAMALAAAPHVLQGANIDNPEKIRRLADSTASLHGLVAFVLENYPSDDSEVAVLEWDADLLAGASSFLYRNLGLSQMDTAERIQRFSGGMRGTAAYMEIDPKQAWQSVRKAAERVVPIEEI